MTMTTFRIDLSYHGAEFAGWATQPGKRTVQELLTDSLSTLLREPVKLAVAGRTDAGVHALGQVASFRSETGMDPGALRHSLNGMTPGDIAINSVASVADDFDARHSARTRTYLYRLQAARVQNPFERGLSLFWPHRIDRGALHACAEALAGAHDFTAFTPTQTIHTRFERDILRSEWKLPAWEEGIAEFWIEADAFMRGMVRALVGTMLEVSSGRRTLESFFTLLEGAPRPEAGDSARPHGLYLAAVVYQDLGVNRRPSPPT